MKTKNKKYLFAFIALLMGASSVFASGSSPGDLTRLSDDQIVTNIIANFRGKVGMDYTFNSIAVSCNNGDVLLTGKVRDGYIMDRAIEAASHVEGVHSVTNRIKLLPASSFDDRIRVSIYRRFLNDPTLFRYFVGKDPAINIIVDSARVTLVGEVNSKVDKARAASRVRELFTVLSVDNQLKVVSS